MYIFDYRNNVLSAESVPLTDIAAKVGTPFYCYAAERIRQNYESFIEPFAGLDIKVHYAVKANTNMAVIRTLALCGAGAEVTSIGELERVLQAGVPPEKIIFNGAGKTREDIVSALLARVYQINADSIDELRLIGQITLDNDRRAPVVVRVNPEFDPRTLRKTVPHYKDSKFGVDIEQLAEALMLAASLPGIEFKGLAVHVGAHGYDYEPFRQAYQTLADLTRICRAQGVPVERLDLGGGMGIPYDGQNVAPFKDYATIVKELIAPLRCALSFEPGRKLVGDAGVLVARVICTKKTSLKNHLIVDAGMNDLLRPALHGARHGVLPVKETEGIALMPITISGPLFEPADVFGENYFLPPMASGDLIALLQAGAYGSSMASAYYSRPLVPEVMVSGSRYAVVRRRVAVAEQISWEGLPPWMEKTENA